MAGWVVAALLVIAGAAVVWLGQARLGRLRRRLEEAEARVAAADAERRRALERDAQLAQALDAMDLGVVVVRADGRTAFRNRSASAYVSARHGDALVEAALVELVEAARLGTVGEREVELIGPPLRSFVIRAFPLLTEGATVRNGAVALVEESTERRRLDQVRRDFVANISHELRTPIGAIGLLVETIREESDPDVVARLSERVGSEVERVTVTIEDLLALSRIESGDDMAIAEVPVGEIVSEALARIGTAAEQRPVRLTTSVPGEASVRGDRRQLVSAVFNLVDNAVKFSRPGGEVTVAVDDVGAAIRIAVRDQGVGIPARDVDRIFERFYRVDRARSRGTGGTGLGLAIVRHVVSNHGGEIRVRSQEGEGSEFSLTLPAAGAPARTGPGAEVAADAPAPVRVEVGGS